MHHSLLSAVLSLSVLLSPLVAAQAAEYTFTTIDAPGSTSTLAFGINAAGQIVGVFGGGTTGNHGFLWDGTTFTNIDVPDARFTTPPEINNLDRIVGSFSEFTDTTLHGFLKDGETFTTFDVPSFIDARGIVVYGSYTFTISLQASRRGNDQDGRRYMVLVSARDIAGNLGRATATVMVPRN